MTNNRLYESGLQQLQITQALVNTWKKQKILLAIFHFIDDHRLAGGQIHKIRIVRYKDGTVNHYEQEPTLQEIHVIRRALNYVIKEHEDEKNRRVP